jgi:hypothetical protein
MWRFRNQFQRGKINIKYYGKNGGEGKGMITSLGAQIGSEALEKEQTKRLLESKLLLNLDELPTMNRNEKASADDFEVLDTAVMVKNEGTLMEKLRAMVESSAGDSLTPRLPFTPYQITFDNPLDINMGANLDSFDDSFTAFRESIEERSNWYISQPHKDFT